MQVNFLFSQHSHTVQAGRSCEIDFVSISREPLCSDRVLTMFSPSRSTLRPTGCGWRTRNGLCLGGITTRQAKQTLFIPGICTCFILPGAAGLLCGKRVASHRQAREFLSAFDAIPTSSVYVWTAMF